MATPPFPIEYHTDDRFTEDEAEGVRRLVHLCLITDQETATARFGYDDSEDGGAVLSVANIDPVGTETLVTTTGVYAAVVIRTGRDAIWATVFTAGVA